MADTKISGLTAASAAALANELAINEAGTSKKVTVAQIKALFGNGTPMLVVAANDSSAKDKALADYLCDGTADDVEVQAALDAVPTTGGTVVLSAGTYAISATTTITANKRILILAHGALFNLAATVTGLRINQGVASTVRGVTVQGLRIDGGSLATTTGLELRDTNHCQVIGVEVANCTVGFLLHSNAASSFVEGASFDNCLLRTNTTGTEFRITSGTGSFMQTMIRGHKTVGSTTGMLIPTGSLMLRSIIQGTFWIDTGQTAVSLDGNIEDATFDLAVEGAGGATGNTALTLGTNLSNHDQAFMKLMLTGTIATQVSNAFTKAMHYWAGGSQLVQTAGVVFGYKRHGDTANRFQIEALTAGGKLSFGTGGAAVDTNLYRSAANILATDDQMDATIHTGQWAPGSFTIGDGRFAYMTQQLILTSTQSATLAGTARLRIDD